MVLDQDSIEYNWTEIVRPARCLYVRESIEGLDEDLSRSCTAMRIVNW